MTGSAAQNDNALPTLTSPRRPKVVRAKDIVPSLPDIAKRAKATSLSSSSATCRSSRQSRTSRAVQDLIASLSDEPQVLKTFDRTKGRIVMIAQNDFPDIDACTRKVFSRLLQDPYEVQQAEMRVGRMQEAEQVRLAAMALRRKAQHALVETTRKGVLDASAALVRTQHALLADFNDLVGHLGSDTRELSMIRVHNAATNEVLHQKAVYTARTEVERFNAIVIDEHVTPVEILTLQLDAFRHRNVVPFPKSNNVNLAASAEGRRKSMDPSAGQRTGIQMIVDKQLSSMHA